jgi:hypothetical protein
MSRTPGQESPRPLYVFDGFGINGPDIYRSRIATFTHHTVAQEHGPFFARAVNSHAATVAALELAEPILDSLLNGSPEFIEPDTIDAALLAVRAALNAAKGGAA